MVIGRRSLLLAGVAVPAAAASARAQCVTDTPTVDACLGGVRITQPPGATLDLSFFGPTLDPSLTFTRASTATYFNAAGTMQTAATNTPRFDYDPVTHAARGLLIEEARTNLLLNSATLGTQSVTVTAAATTLSFYGTGTVTLSGVSTAGPLTGTGASNRVSLTFTPTAGTLTLTVTGSVLNAQLEAASYATSYISTAGAAATRAADVAAMAGTNFSGWFNNATGSLSAEVAFPVVVAGYIGRLVELSDGTTANFLAMIPSFGTAYQLASTIASVAGTTLTATATTVAMATIKACGAYGGGNRSFCVNASTVVSTAGGIATVTQINLGNRPDNIRGGAVYIRRMQFWPRVLSNAEMQQVTR